MRDPVLAVGLMSGTSLDGLTAALVRIEEPEPEVYSLKLLASRTIPYGASRQSQLAAAIRAGGPRDLALLHRDLGEWSAECVETLLDDAGVAAASVALVASHGQTVWHEPGQVSYQLGDPAVIAERLGVLVVSDFRARDVAAGGQGAPLVPRADRLLWAREGAPRVLLNLGGIANLTAVPPRGSDEPLLAFDTGPGVMVIDACVRRLFPGMRFDAGGEIASRGRVLEPVLEAALSHPFFSTEPPRSTGRELFGDGYADGLVARCLEVSSAPEDAVATATALTARAIGAAAGFIPARLRPADVVRSGGGSRNPALVRAIEAAWPGVEHRAFDELFFDGEAKEAAAFAFLGYLTWTGRPGNEPGATGARGPRVLGSITPA
ncbi:MAG TPA: anhydro-N-acetylmuramic acid kinase [Gemmatimonadales bacterium]|nr:anhydro-N-acetylmuramic acid kinase [Gemmatimonadales bacterium]